jgi:Na+/melibiose symporter-like transporter
LDIDDISSRVSVYCVSQIDAMGEASVIGAMSVRTNAIMRDVTRPKLNLLVKLALGLGTSPETIVLIGFELFVLFYYTQILGLSGTLTGIALFIAMCLDGLSDPILGTFSDNLRNAPFGRRHTLMFLAPIPLGLFFALVFTPPQFVHGLGLFAWLTVTMVACRIATTLFVVPNSAQVAEAAIRRSAPRCPSIAACSRPDFNWR